MFSALQIEKIRRRVLRSKNGYLTGIFHALSDPCRLAIFQLLILEKKVCVTDVARVCKISLPAASQQLKILELTGMVKKERMGQMVCYALQRENPSVQTFVKIIHRSTV